MAWRLKDSSTLEYGAMYQQVHEDDDGYDERNQMVCESVE